MDFTDVEARWQVVTAYTRAGLVRGERVMVVLDPSDLNDDDAVSRLDGGTGHAQGARMSGQLVVARNTDAYVPDGRLDKERQIRTYSELLARTREEGYKGLRVGADAAFAPRAGVDDDQLVDYETSVEPLFANPDLTALCWYDRDLFNEHIVATMRKVHPLQVMERLGVLEVSRSPNGGRIAGSAEAGTSAEFIESLREMLEQRPTDSPLRFELDLTDLCYLETRCAWQLIDFAAALPESHTLVVRCGPTLEMALRGLGSDDVTQLDLRVEDSEAV
jgi:DcmR-like sensory protein